MPREIKKFPKDGGTDSISLRVPAYFLSDVKKLVYNPFSDYETLTEFILDAMWHRLEDQGDGGVSESTKRIMALAEIEQREQDLKREMELFSQITKDPNNPDLRKMLPLCSKDHQDQFERMYEQRTNGSATGQRAAS